MSLHPHALPPVPEETARIARKAFRRGNPYLTLRDELGPLFTDRDFLALYALAGPPALSPARLILVTLAQYMEDLTDEQAAEAVRSRLDWKYLLSLPLADEGFDASVLVEFRKRLVAGEAGEQVLERVLAVAQERGLLRGRGRQRTDSTHVLAAIRVLNRLELVGETLRQALNTLALLAPAWLRGVSAPAWPERYGPRIAAARLPTTPSERELLLQQIGEDGFTLLAALAAPDAPAGLAEQEVVQTLRRVWVQQFEQHADGPRLRAREELDPGAEIVSSPYDPDARWSTKRETSWVGYKVHLTETCDQALPRLITDVQTTHGAVPDDQMVSEIHHQLDLRQLLPAEQLLDSGYVTGPHCVTSRRQYGIRMIGPAKANTSWQARAAQGYEAAAFQLDWQAQRATCPAGKQSSTWRPVTNRRGNQVIQIHFRAADCRHCAVRERCTRDSRRSLTVLPQEEQEALLAVRAEQRTSEGAAAYAQRAGIEGTMAQAVRRTGLRQARYRGIAKVRLQHVLTAAALNLIRLIAWLHDVPVRTTRASAYARLMAAST